MELADLRAEIAASTADFDARQRGVKWHMKVDHVRCEFKSVYTQFTRGQTPRLETPRLELLCENTSVPT